ncbi:MAG: hypothetical protein IPJ17_11560 [Holophagales bacterium]|nr:MAG: hypothetical protein IPJ17_11560 [Holophagales bacterium]
METGDPGSVGVVQAVAGWRRSLALVAVFLLALLGAWLFAARAPVLVDTDSYYHLAVARVLRFEGWPAEFRWARLSLLGPPGGFPDKEPLFHLLLAPLVGEGPSTAGGRLGLALLAAAIAVAIAVPARRLVGPVGLALPFALVLLALDVPDRLMRLRPELLSLLLLLLAAELTARGRDRLVGAVAFLYVLSYTAFHLLLALVALWFLWRGLVARRWSWALPLYAGLGTGLGLLVHPAFPRNLELWAVQNVFLFGFVEKLGAGGQELRSATSAELLTKNLGWWLAAALVLALRGRTTAEDPESSRHEFSPFAVGALVFGLMYVAMWRFGVYFFPFATLALAGDIARRPLARDLSPIGLGKIPTRVALASCLVVSLPSAVAMGRYFLDRSAPGPPRELEWAAFGRAVPEGVRVAAPWAQAEAYLWFAPQGRYLNFLDPILMAMPFPRESALERELFAGREPDLALAIRLGLDSEYLAFSRFAAPARLRARAEGDPRFERVYAGYNLLYRVHRGRNRAFLLDWSVGPAAPLGAEAGGIAVAYPRASPGAAAELEGFVDAGRIGLAGTCARFVGALNVPADGTTRWELAPYGPASLDVDGRSVVALNGSSGAVLGEGAILDLPLPAGEHRLEVISCPDRESGRNGFYLLRR